MSFLFLILVYDSQMMVWINQLSNWFLIVLGINSEIKPG